MEKYKISVIIPVYKNKSYINEAINSCLNQTIGKNEVQIILINGENDVEYENICKNFEMKYENILYLKLNSDSIFSTKELLSKYIKGKYVTFLSSTDKWEKDSFEKGFNMLEENKDIDLVSFRIKYFDHKKGFHLLDYKFDGDYIVDLNVSFDKIQPSLQAVLFRSSLLKTYNCDFDFEIINDVKLVSQIIIDKMKYGMISSSCYNYRVYNSNNDKKINLLILKNSYMYLIKNCLDKFGYVPKYIQYVLIDGIKQFLDYNINFFDNKEKYIKLLKEIINYCDDDIITLYYKSNIEYMIYNLNFKYNKSITSELYVKNNYVYYDKTKLFSVNDLKINVYNFQINKSVLNIDCIFNNYKSNCFDIYIVINNKKYKMKNLNTYINLRNIIGYDNKYYDEFYTYEIEDISSVSNISFLININNKYYPLDLNFVRYSKLNNLKNSYFKYGKYIFRHTSREIIISNKVKFNCIKYLYEILFYKKDIMLFCMLLLYYFTYPFVKHDNWIISDRYDVSGDNGEYLFKYINENNKKKNVYFALSKNSKDLNKMKKYGKVIKFNSLSFYLKYLNSEAVISSHLDDFIYKPFRGKQIYLNFILRRKYVFLQHGITQTNLSGWLSKYNNKIDLFIASAINEYNSLLHPDYMYDKNVVKLTGFPRYDNLLKSNISPKNIIALMPTWRTILVGDVINGTQDRKYNPNFKESDYYKFYNGIINNDKLKKILNEYNFKILFCLHPSLKAQYNDFNKNEYTDIIFYPDYQKVFKESKFLITDYSSVFFDFAYLKKPILYTQFDTDDIIKIHSIYKENNFIYEKEGFGDVVYNLDDTIERIIYIIKNDCKMEEKYKKRVDKFFKFKDNKNCERVYNSILEILK